MADFCRKNGISDGSCGMRSLIDWIMSAEITGDPYISALHKHQQSDCRRGGQKRHHYFRFRAYLCAKTEKSGLTVLRIKNRREVYYSWQE